MKKIVLFKKAAAVLCALAMTSLARADRTELLWQKVPGDYSWLGTVNNERGLAYNPVTKHVLVPSRTGGNIIHVLNAADGSEVPSDGDPTIPKTLDATGISGGTFAINMIGVGDDGAIYVCNLTTGSTTSPFKVYRWADENAAPTVAYSGDPTGGTAGVRFGDSFFVRGGGATTQLIAGTRATANVGIFTTTDGLTFTANYVSGAGVATGQLGVAFGAGNTAWSKLNGGSPLRHYSFNLTTKTATLIEAITVSPNTIGPIGSDPSGKYLGVIATDAQATARVYDVGGSGATLVGELKFTTSNANGNGIGGVDIGDSKAFFLEPNNGIIALSIVVEVTPVTIQTPPASISVIEGGKAQFTVTAAGTPPLTYQWTHAGTNLPGATASTLNVAAANADTAGEYKVTVSNAAGAVPSNPATLTVLPIVRSSHLNLRWKILPGDRPWIANDNNTRGIAINKVTGNVLVVSRTGLGVGATAQVRVLDGSTGADKGVLNVDTTIIKGGTFTLNMIGVADDGAVYGANLTTDSGSSAFIVYRWDNDSPETVPVVVYIGDPSNGSSRTEDRRFGDSFDVRGSGDTTQILAGSRNGNIASIIFPNADPLLAAATAIVSDGPDGEFGLGVAFGSGNSIYGTATAALLRLVSFDDPIAGQGSTIPGTVVHAYTSDEVPTAVSNVAFDPTSNFLAGNAIENPDDIRLYSIGGDGTATLVDQELWELDNPNINGTGSLDFGLNKLVTLNSNNGIMVFDFAAVVGATLSNASIGGDGKFSFTVTGDPGTVYTIQSTTSLTPPVSWTTLPTVTIGAGGTATFTDATPTGPGARFYRAVNP